MAIKITPLSDALGVEVKGVDLARDPTKAEIGAIDEAIAKHLVVVVRDQKFTPADYVAAARLFGMPMQQHLTDFLMPDFPDIAVLSSADAKTGADGLPILTGVRHWHTDHTNRERPPKITILYAVKLPQSGGDTSFANMRKAFARLPENEQKSLLLRKTTNTIEGRPYVSDKDNETFKGPFVHPLVRTHPVTGEKALYFHPSKTAHIDDMSGGETQNFLADLVDRTVTPDVIYRHKWREGDMLLCDNRAVLHKAHRDYDHREGRVMHRIILEGDVPF